MSASFGSLARGEATPTSDIDVLVEFDRPVGLFEFIRLKIYLEELIGRRVDLVTPDALCAAKFHLTSCRHPHCACFAAKCPGGV